MYQQVAYGCLSCCTCSFLDFNNYVFCTTESWGPFPQIIPKKFLLGKIFGSSNPRKEWKLKQPPDLVFQWKS